MNGLKKLLVLILAIIALFYLLNPSAGIFELVPDNIPIVGNIDEGLAAYVLFSCIQFFRGKRIGLFDKKKDVTSKIMNLKEDKRMVQL